MKYKVLLTGKNNAAIDEFFTKMYNSFECQTTSKRYEDMISHMHAFNPDAFVYCLQDEPVDDITKIISMKSRNAGQLPLIIIGDAADCDKFTKAAVKVADLILQRPLTAAVIEQRINVFLKQQKRMHEPIAEELKKADLAFNETFPPKTDVPDVTDMPDIRDIANIPGMTSGKKHILVIDDDARMLKVIKLHLHEKYDVATAISGKIALKFLETKHTDLILLDYAMPDENGLVVLEKLRANPSTKNIPVIFLTGITDRKKIQEALVMKPQGYLLKPINRKRLLAAIQNTLEA